MRFFCSAKICFDPKMDLHISALKPAPATFGQFRRLRNLRHAQNVTKESTCDCLLARRHGELHVIDGNKFRFAVRFHFPGDFLTDIVGAIPCGHFSRMVGSPNRINVLRTS